MIRLERFRSSSLFSRVAWGIVIGFLLLHGGTLMFYNHEKMVAEAGAFATAIAERALTIAEVASDRPELLALLSTPSFALSWESDARPTPRRTWPHSDEVRAVLIPRLTELALPDPQATRVWYTVDSRGRRMVLQLPLHGRWLVVQAEGPGASGHTLLATFWTTLLGGTILVAVLWATRRFTRVLPRVADAAEQVGRGSDLPALPETGPREIRRLTRVFNAMQQRVGRLLAERNTMLGALSHDVRTLVTRLSLRLENIEDADARNKSMQDVEAITSLLDEALAFASNEASNEPQMPVDLSSMLQALLDDAADQGANATYSGPDSLVLSGEPVGLRRAFGNLIDNALRYGGAVDVQASLADGQVCVDVSDPGPGIAESDWPRVLEPFVRLESSRNRATGGSGLGLSIAWHVVERHRGELEFLRSERGFTVRVHLPVA